MNNSSNTNFESISNQSTALYVTIFGLLIAISGSIHGIYSIIKGNISTHGMLLADIGAFTVIQNYLITGILAVSVGTLIFLWTIFYIRSKIGPLIFILLSIALFLFGGGFAQIPGIVLTWALSTRIHRPLSFWEKLTTIRIRKRLSKFWAYFLLIGFTVFIIGYSIWLFVLPPGEAREIGTMQYICWYSLAIGFILLLLAVPCGFCRDLRIRLKESA